MKTDGGPAFLVGGMRWDGSSRQWYPVPGMSLRDWFAGMALQGILASDRNQENILKDHAVKWAWMYSDAMLEAREVEDEEP